MITRMQKYLNVRCLLALMFLFGPVTLTGSHAQPGPLELPEDPGERIILISDRDLYTASEDILFTARYEKSWLLPDGDWSTVLYAELIRWDGTSYSTAKIPIRNGIAYGSLHVPEGLKSGNYYLRAYTRWMRNYSPSAYSYLPLKVINPNTDEIDPGPPEEVLATSDIPVFVRDTVLETGPVISGIDPVYGPREAIEFSIGAELSMQEGSYAVSIVPEGAAVPGSLVLSDPVMKAGSGEGITFYPENEGLAISAKLVDGESGEPVSGMKVNLSSFTNSFHYGTSMTDEQGIAHFYLPFYHGTHEFYMVAEGSGSKEAELFVNSDFCTRPVTLPYEPFVLKGSEEDRAARLVLNAQIGSRFSKVSEPDPVPDMQYAFYGSPEAVIHEADFIELKDLQEFFFELVPNVSVFSPNRDPYLFVHSNTSLATYPPLVMIDNIPVVNDHHVLEIPCNRIERIEVIDRGYVVGPYKYSGVVSIYSLGKDIAGYALPENSHFFNYSLFSRFDPQWPDYDGPGSFARIPDLRNTLYWKPDVTVSQDADNTLRFFTSDVPGTYRVIVRGVNKEGKVTERSATFMVEKEGE